MKRLFDLILAVCAAVVLSLPLGLVGLLVRLTSKGPVLYWSDRVGRNNLIFRMPKFRTMRVGTPAVATICLLIRLRTLPRSALFCVSQAWTSCLSSGASSKAI